MNAPNTDCLKTQELAMLAADMPEALDAAEKALLDSHVAKCGPCQAYQISLQNLIQSIQGLEPIDVPRGLTDQVMTRVQESRETKTVPAAKPLSLQKYIPLAASVFFLALALTLMLPDNRTGNGTNVAQVNPAQPPVRQPSPPVSQQPPQVHQPEQMATGTQAISPGTARPVVSGTQPAHTGNTQTQGAQSPRQNTTAGRPVQSTARKYEPVDTTVLQGELVASTVAEEVVASEDQSDIYYDPLSDVVGF